MIHQPSGGVQGQATDIQIQATEILKLKQQINELYVKHTGQNLEEIGVPAINICRLYHTIYKRFLFHKNHIVGKSMERDNFMSPTQAKEFGIIDKVLAHPMQEETAEAAMEKTDSVTTKS